MRRGRVAVENGCWGRKKGKMNGEGKKIKNKKEKKKWGQLVCGCLWKWQSMGRAIGKRKKMEEKNGDRPPRKKKTKRKKGNEKRKEEGMGLMWGYG